MREEYFNSEQFRKNMKAAIETNTWGKGYPMSYMDDKGRLVKHWKDGRIIKIKDLKIKKNPSF